MATARHRRLLSASGGGARQFALRATTLRISRDFTVKASARFASVQHEHAAFSAPSSAAADLLRPSAEEA
jgi:hypothetical protein